MGSGADLRAMIQGVTEQHGISLTPVERLLLSTDGTVTHALEALVMEEVMVDILNREVTGGTLDRQVTLRRSSDRSELAWADSDVNLYPLSVEVEDELVHGDMGIGDLLRDQYAETRREIVSMDAIWANESDTPTFIDPKSALYLTREYEIYSDDSRVMTIREWFPKGLF